MQIYVTIFVQSSIKKNKLKYSVSYLTRKSAVHSGREKAEGLHLVHMMSSSTAFKTRNKSYLTCTKNYKKWWIISAGVRERSYQPSRRSYPVKQRQSIAHVQVAMSATRRQNSHVVKSACRVVQPIRVHSVVELHEVRVQRDHRHAVWRGLSDDGVNRR